MNKVDLKKNAQIKDLGCYQLVWTLLVNILH